MKMHQTLDQALTNLNKARMEGQQVKACCPAHGDKNPSLSISEKDGKILVHCHAGCKQEDVINALNAKGVHVRTTQQNTQNDLKYWPVKRNARKPDFGALLKHRPDDVWTYFDKTGDNILGYIVRYHLNGKKEIRPITPWKDDHQKIHWQLKALPEPRPLYGLELLQQNPDQPILIVEGEKAADAGRSSDAFADYIVVTWAGGANAANKTDWMPLKGRTIKIWPDNDDAGRKAAVQITDILQEMDND